MTRRSVLGLTATLLIPMATLVACGSDSDGPNPTTPAGSAVPTSLTPTQGSAVDDNNGNGDGNGGGGDGGGGAPVGSGGG